MSLRCKASVTFEFATRPPVTHRIAHVREAAGPQTLVQRAVIEGKRALKPIGWTSLVVVLERDADAVDVVVSD